MSQSAVQSKSSEQPHVSTPQIHTLKTWPEYIEPIAKGEKTFDVRKNDRDFRVGDVLHLQEWHPGLAQWGSRSLTCSVTYILHGPNFGIQEGYCVMAITRSTQSNV